MKLYYSIPSPYCQKVLIAFKEKGIKFESKQVTIYWETPHEYRIFFTFNLKVKRCSGGKRCVGYNTFNKDNVISPKLFFNNLILFIIVNILLINIKIKLLYNIHELLSILVTVLLENNYESFRRILSIWKWTSVYLFL